MLSLQTKPQDTMVNGTEGSIQKGHATIITLNRGIGTFLAKFVEDQ